MIQQKTGISGGSFLTAANTNIKLLCASSCVGSLSSGIRQVQLSESAFIKSEIPKAKVFRGLRLDLGSTSYCIHCESGYFENCISFAVDTFLLQILLKRNMY